MESWHQTQYGEGQDSQLEGFAGTPARSKLDHKESRRSPLVSWMIHAQEAGQVGLSSVLMSSQLLHQKLGALAGFFHILLVWSGSLIIPFAAFIHVNISPSSETVRYTPAGFEGRSKTHSDTVACEHCIQSAAGAQCTRRSTLSVEICLFPVVLIRITCHFCVIFTSQLHVPTSQGDR